MGKCNCLIPTILSDPCAKDKLHICRELRQAFASQGMCMILQPNQLLHSKPAAIEGFYVAVAKHFNRMRLAVGGNTYTSAVRRAAVAAAAAPAHRGKMVSKSLVAAAAHGGWHSLLSCTHSNNGHKFSLVVERLFACLLTRPCLLFRL
jgi:hypothetical protein